MFGSNPKQKSNFTFLFTVAIVGRGTGTGAGKWVTSLTFVTLITRSYCEGDDSSDVSLARTRNSRMSWIRFSGTSPFFSSEPFIARVQANTSEVIITPTPSPPSRVVNHVPWKCFLINRKMEVKSWWCGWSIFPAEYRMKLISLWVVTGNCFLLGFFVCLHSRQRNCCLCCVVFLRINIKAICNTVSKENITFLLWPIISLWLSWCLYLRKVDRNHIPGEHQSLCWQRYISV